MVRVRVTGTVRVLYGIKHQKLAQETRKIVRVEAILGHMKHSRGTQISFLPRELKTQVRMGLKHYVEAAKPQNEKQEVRLRISNIPQNEKQEGRFQNSNISVESTHDRALEC